MIIVNATVRSSRGAGNVKTGCGGSASINPTSGFLESVSEDSHSLLSSCAYFVDGSDGCGSARVSMISAS